MVPQATYPEPAEDIGQAIAWIIANASEVAQDSNIKLDIDHIFLMGNSAGAAHVVTLALAPNLLSQDIRTRVRGIILLGGAYSFPVDNPSLSTYLEVLRQYYGSDDEIRKHQPLSLLKNATPETINSLPDILVLKDEWEPATIDRDHGLFVNALRERRASKVDEDVLKGHNHISPGVSLSSGEGEEWGKNVADWINARGS